MEKGKQNEEIKQKEEIKQEEEIKQLLNEAILLGNNIYEKGKAIEEFKTNIEELENQRRNIVKQIKKLDKQNNK